MNRPRAGGEEGEKRHRWPRCSRPRCRGRGEDQKMEGAPTGLVGTREGGDEVEEQDGK